MIIQQLLRYRWNMLMTWTLNTRISGLPCLQNPTYPFFNEFVPALQGSEQMLINDAEEEIKLIISRCLWECDSHQHDSLPLPRVVLIG